MIQLNCTPNRKPRRTVFQLGIYLIVSMTVLSLGCQSPDLPLTERERYFAAANNQENRVRAAVERYQYAQQKAEQFEQESTRVESHYAAMMAKMREAQSQKDRFTAELAALADQSGKLQLEITTARQNMIGAQQELAKVQLEVSDLEKNRLLEDGRKKELVGRLEEAKAKNEKGAEQINALLKELTAE